MKLMKVIWIKYGETLVKEQEEDYLELGQGKIYKAGFQSTKQEK